jgi:hypothetical protein
MTVLGYARFYDSIASMLPSDKPSDDVIENDAELDRWYQNYVREMAIKSGKKQKVGGDSQVPMYDPSK